MASTYEPIATTTLGSDTASVTLSSISGSYTDLILIAFMRSTRSATDDSFYMTLNGDTAGNYSATRLLGDGSSASSARNTNTGRFTFDIMAAGSTASGTYSPNIFHFNNYSNSTTYKTVLYRGNNANGYVIAEVGLWRSTAAITSIKIEPYTGPNLASGSTFTLYGILAA